MDSMNDNKHTMSDPYNYFEIFGLNKEQQEELEDFYKKALKDL